MFVWLSRSLLGLWSFLCFSLRFLEFQPTTLENLRETPKHPTTDLEKLREDTKNKNNDSSKTFI